MTITIYHNPRCSKSRQTLALIEEKGIKPEVVEYLQTPPTAEELKNILQLLGLSAKELLRQKESVECGLDPSSLTEEELVAGMVANPRVIERPIVVKGDKAVVGRPPENVLTLI